MYKNIDLHQDVTSNNWFNNAVSTLTNANIVEGFPGRIANIFLKEELKYNTIKRITWLIYLYLSIIEVENQKLEAGE